MQRQQNLLGSLTPCVHPLSDISADGFQPCMLGSLGGCGGFPGCYFTHTLRPIQFDKGCIPPGISENIFRSSTDTSTLQPLSPLSTRSPSGTVQFTDRDIACWLDNPSETKVPLGKRRPLKRQTNDRPLLVLFWSSHKGHLELQLFIYASWLMRRSRAPTTFLIPPLESLSGVKINPLTKAAGP